MSTKLIITRCNQCPRVIHSVPVTEPGSFDDMMEEARRKMFFANKEAKCPACANGHLTVTSEVVPGDLKKASDIEKPVVSEVDEEIARSEQAKKWLVSKGKEGSVLYRALETHIEQLLLNSESLS